MALLSLKGWMMNSFVAKKAMGLASLLGFILALASASNAMGQSSGGEADSAVADAPTAESILSQVDGLVIEIADNCAQRFDFAFSRKYNENPAEFRVRKIMSAIALYGEFDTFGRQGNLALAESAYRRHQDNENSAYAELGGIVDVAMNDPDYHVEAKHKFVGRLYYFHSHLRKACGHLTDISYVRKYYLAGDSIFYGSEKERYEAIFEELVASGAEHNQTESTGSVRGK
jgi:hypothetical protein